MKLLIYVQAYKTVSFVLDSGATKLMVKESIINLMSSVTEHNPASIANSKPLVSNKRDTFEVAYKDKNIKILALIVPNLMLNLLSVKKLNNEDLSVVFERNKAAISNKEKSFKMILNQEGNLYVALLQTKSQVECNLALYSDLWHKKLKHLCNKYFKKIELP